MGKKSKQKADESAKKPGSVSKEQLQDIDDLFSSAKSKKRQLVEESEQQPAKARKAVKVPKLDLPERIIEEEEDIHAQSGLVRKKRKPLRAVAADSSGPYGVIQSKRHPSRIISPEAPLERIDKETGLPVYKAHILRVGEGGGTALCPFDCDCCF